MKSIISIFNQINTRLFPASSQRYKWWILANVMLGTFMAVLDSTIVNVGLPAIMSYYHEGIGSAQWVTTGYMLSMSVMLLTAGWFAERFGYKLVYIIGMVIFTAGSFLCSISSSMELLIASRVFQGFGSGMIQPLGLALISREFSPQQRGLAIGFWAIAAAASVSLGPFVGGYLVQNMNWHYIFMVNIPIGIFAIATTLIIQRETERDTKRRFDPQGFILIVLWLPLLIVGLSIGSSPANTRGWLSPFVMIALGVSIMAMVLFIEHSLRSKSPLLDLRLFKDRNFAVSIIILFLIGIGLFGGNFLLPLYLQHSLGYSAFTAGAVFLPVGIIQGALAPVAGSLGRRFGNKLFIVVGLLIFVIYFYLSSRFTIHTPHWFIMLSLYLRGLGIGLLFTPLNTLAISNISREKMGDAAGISNTVKQFSGSLGIAILTSILMIRTAYHAKNEHGTISTDRQIYHSAVYTEIKNYAIKGIDLDKESVEKHQNMLSQAKISQSAYVKGIDDDFFIVMIISSLGFIPILALKRVGQKPKR